MRIRPAEPADSEAMSRIAVRAYGGYEELIGGRPHPMDDDYGEKARQGNSFVAEDGAVVGLLVLVPGGDDLLIENVAVDPDRQGEGIGRALLDWAESCARELRLTTLRLYTNEAMTRNIAMYLRLGYDEDERRTVNGFHRVFLSKRL